MLLDAALPKTGVVRNAATAIVYATHEMGGLGFKDIHVTQLIEYIKFYWIMDQQRQLQEGYTRMSPKQLSSKGDAEETFTMSTTQLNIRGLIIIRYGQQFRTCTHTLQPQNDIQELADWRENDIFLMDKIITKHSD